MLENAKCHQLTSKYLNNQSGQIWDFKPQEVIKKHNLGSNQEKSVVARFFLVDLLIQVYSKIE